MNKSKNIGLAVRSSKKPADQLLDGDVTCSISYIDPNKRFAFARSDLSDRIYIPLASKPWSEMEIEIGGTLTCLIRRRERGPEAARPISYMPPSPIEAEDLVAWVKAIPESGPYLMQTLDGRKISLPRDLSSRIAGGGLKKIRLWSVKTSQHGRRLTAIEPPRNLGMSVEGTAAAMLGAAGTNVDSLSLCWKWLIARAKSPQERTALRRVWSDLPECRNLTAAEWLCRDVRALTDDELRSVVFPGVTAEFLAELVISAISVGRKSALQQIVESADQLFGGFVSKQWGKMAQAASSTTSDMLLTLISICAKRGWPIDGYGFASFAKASDKLKSPECFSIIVRACAAAGWPLDKGPWLTFITACGRLRAQEDFRRLIDVSIERLDSMPTAILGLLALVAVQFRMDAQFAIIVSYCRVNGWPQERQTWTKMISAAARSNRTDLLPEIIAARRANGALEQDEFTECIDAIKSAVHFAARDDDGARLSQLRELISDLWEGYLGVSEDLDAFTIFMSAASLLDDLSILEAGSKWLSARRDLWSRNEPAYARAALELAIALLKHDFRANLRVASNLLQVLQGETYRPRVMILSSYLSAFDGESDGWRGTEWGAFDIRCTDDEVEILLAAVDGPSMRKFLARAQEDRWQSNDEWIQRLQELNELSKYVRQGRADPYVLLQIGRRFRGQGDYAAAHKYFVEASEIEDGKNQSICAYENGLTYLDEGNWREALSWLRSAITLSEIPINSQLTKAAEAATNIGEFGLAVTWLEDILRRDPADTRAFVQLAGTIVAGFRQGYYPPAMLATAEKAIGDALGSASTEKRLARELASLIVSLHELNPLAGDVVICRASDALLPSICEALVAGRIWTESLLAAALSRLFSSWPILDTAKPLIRYIAAGLTHAYFSGKLGQQSYRVITTYIFTQIFSSNVLDKHKLIFEIFVARRDFLLREILGEYAKLANRVIYRFLLDISSGKDLAILSLALADINRLLLDELPAQLTPQGYGDSDTVNIEPRLKMLSQKLETRASMLGARTDISIESEPGQATECALMAWMGIRSAIAELMPSNTESPFLGVGQVSVPWKVTFRLRQNAVHMDLAFPSKIHPNNDPKKLLREAHRRVNAWAYEQKNCQVDAAGWSDGQRISIKFITSAPSSIRKEIHESVFPFVDFLCHENLRVLNGGALSSAFFEDAWANFSVSSRQQAAFGPDEWHYCHQYMLDAHFGVTTEWLFIGETLSERPDYHPRYELHKLKGYVIKAIKQISQQSNVSSDVIDLLRDRLVRMRKNIYLTLKKMIPSDAPDEVITDVIPVIRDAVSQVLSDARTEVEFLSPPTAPAKVGRFSLHSAVFNLLMNAYEAVDHLHEPKVSIQIAIDGESTWIQIANHFDPSSEPKKHGTGIGLADTKFHVEEISGGRFHTEVVGRDSFVAKIILRR